MGRITVGLHDAERDHMPGKTFPNYALMKLSAYYKQQGAAVSWWDGLSRFDLVYSSKVFNFTPVNPYLPEGAILGGTGYDLRSQLPEEIDAISPDYSLYPGCGYALGFLTRGCPNNCEWCLVPDKEGDIRPYREWPEVVRPDSDQLVLMDNNILSLAYGTQQLAGLVGSGYRIDLNQGMEARLVTPAIAELLSRLDWIRFIRFSCDSLAQTEPVIRACELLGRHGIRPYRIFIYLLVRRDVEDAARRVELLKRLRGINLYAQAERPIHSREEPTSAQMDFHRYVYGGLFREITWEEYEKRQGGGFG